ncbi:hypothetical protein A2U01_0023545, partial [Trifolium medium]|nr:hypothetical protein [Trifolium medium]
KYAAGPIFLIFDNLSSGSPTWSSIIHENTSSKMVSLDGQLSVKDVISSCNPHTQIFYTQLTPLVSAIINKQIQCFHQRRLHLDQQQK